MTKHSRRKRDKAFMSWIHTQPCLLAGWHECEGPIEADHAGLKVGYRAPDNTCLPLCRKAHADRHAARGIFEAMTKPQRKTWCRDMIEQTQARYAAREWSE